MQCNLLEGDVLYAFKVAYDPDFRKFCPVRSWSPESSGSSTIWA